MAAVPVGQAQRGGEDRRVGGVELAEQRRNGRGRRPRRRPAGATRNAVFRRRVRGRGADRPRPRPIQAALLVERGRAIVPHQQRARRASGHRGDALGMGAQRIGAVEPGAGEKGVSGQCPTPALPARPRRRGGRGWEAGLAEPAERLPPAFARRRLAGRDQVEVEREVGKAMAHRGDGGASAARRPTRDRAAPPLRRAARARGAAPATPPRRARPSKRCRGGAGARALSWGRESARARRWRRRGSRRRGDRRGKRASSGGRSSRQGPSLPGQNRRGGRLG